MEPVGAFRGKQNLPEGDAQRIFSTEIVDYPGQGSLSRRKGLIGIIATPERPHEKTSALFIDDFAFGGYAPSGLGIGFAPGLSRLDEPDSFESHAGVDMPALHLLERERNAAGHLDVRAGKMEITVDLLLRNHSAAVFVGFGSESDLPAVVGEHEPVATHLHPCAERKPVGQRIPIDGNGNATAVVLKDDFAAEFAVEVIGHDLSANGCILRDADRGFPVAQRLESGDRAARFLGCFVKSGFGCVVAGGEEQQTNEYNRSHRAV